MAPEPSEIVAFSAVFVAFNAVYRGHILKMMISRAAQAPDLPGLF
jgi:hypothetical protein